MNTATQSVIDTSKMMESAYTCNFQTISSVLNVLAQRRELGIKYERGVGHTEQTREQLRNMTSQCNKMVIDILGLITID